MKKIFAFVCINLWLIIFCVAVHAQEFRTIQEGIEYAEIKRGTEKEPVKINLLRLDLSKVRLDVVHAKDAAIGLETTSSMATRRGATAAINAGFFRLDKSIFAGDAAGVLQIDGKLLSESNNSRIALAISNGKNKTEIIFGHLKTGSWIGFSKDSMIPLSGINRERRSSEMILYKPGFYPNTLTDSEGTEVVFKIKCKPPQRTVSAEFCTAKIIEVREQSGGAQIFADNYVVSIGKDAPQDVKSFQSYVKKYPDSDLFRFGNEFITSEAAKKNAFEKAEDIVGGVPQLVKNGVIEITWEQEKSSKAFVETRHPRTAVARLKDGKFLMATVDGRQPNVSVGMNLNELAEMLLELGAIDAMNLDGGGSTTMFLGGKVVNQPSDKEGERKVSDAILVFPRKRN
jgi:exopolysaccharide biosynthesis protein